MRVIRLAQVMAATLALTLGTSALAVSAATDDMTPPVRGVVAAVELEPPTSLGTFSVSDGIYHHRDVPVTGLEIFADDARLTGLLEATFNYDVARSGGEPVPAWGTMSIGDGAWTGTFTGLRRHDFEPFDVHAFLIGTGEYDGLCAVLDITAGSESWAINGVVHPLPMDT